MSFSMKEEIEKADIEDFLPQNLSHKFLAYFGLKIDDFIEQFSFDNPEENKDKKIKFDPDILDVVTKIYTTLHGDHEVDTSDIQNILNLQKKLNEGAVNYSLAVYRESFGRDLNIEYEKPVLDTILTKNPNSYDCAELFKHIKEKKCANCSHGITNIAESVKETKTLH